MNKRELYALLDIESPEEFEYFENLADYLECEEELDYTDVAVVRDYAQTVKQEVYHSSNLWGRCRMRFVKCLI